MTFGELRALLHAGGLPPLFATLPEDQQGYVERLVGDRLEARAERMRLAGWLVYAENPLHWKTRKKIDPALYPLLRWYSCDVADESLRIYGNEDPHSLRAIEVARLYVLGKAGEEDLRQARKDAAGIAAEAAAGITAEAAAAAVVSYATYTAAYAAVYVTAAAEAEVEADAATYTAYAWSARYDKHRTLLINWLRAYLMRWIEEGDWWE